MVLEKEERKKRKVKDVQHNGEDNVGSRWEGLG